MSKKENMSDTNKEMAIDSLREANSSLKGMLGIMAPAAWMRS